MLYVFSEKGLLYGANATEYGGKRKLALASIWIESNDLGCLRYYFI